VRDALPDADGRAPLIVVVGVGNSLRGDDAAGLEVVRRLEGRLPDGVGIVETELEPTRLLDAWEGADAAVLVDAVRSGALPGTVHRFDVVAAAVPHSLARGSTHHFSLAETIELARALGRLPAAAVLYGIEGARFEAGEALTEAVERGVAEAVEAIVEEVERCTSTR
jgi:hydrogenase maturation protease